MKEELQELVAAGLTPNEALQAATPNPAQFLNARAEFGTVSVGRQTDLVLLTANPLDDISNAFQQEGFMLHGQWFRESKLQSDLAHMAATYAAPTY